MAHTIAASQDDRWPGSGARVAGASGWLPQARGCVRAWVNTPEGGVALLIATTLAARLAFAASLGLGIDESYVVAVGRDLHLSYFDHPPLGWWMAWAGGHLFGTDAAWAVRLPFVLAFAGTTWLMFALTRRLFGACAGLWAAAAMNATPVLGVTSASWVLPDGPLLAALLAAAYCLHAALPAAGRAAWRWWVAAGLCAGFGLLAKYSALLTIAGAALFLLTEPRARAWLRRPHPYAAAIVAAAVFSPVLAWNAQHGWVSLLFQGGRAAASRFHPFGPLSTLAGEALFILPWVWVPLAWLGALALWRGAARPESWLLACLALPPVALFAVLSFWSHILFHWAAPGYLMLFPLLGEAVGRRHQQSRAVRLWLAGTAAAVMLGVTLVATEVHFNWLPEVAEDFALGADPDMDAVDWTSLPQELDRRGLLGVPHLVVGATRWFDAGKADYALEGRMRVICLGPDPREYGLIAPASDYAGDDVLLLAPRATLEQVGQRVGAMFDSIEELPPVMLLHAGRPGMLLPMFLGHRLHAAPTQNPGA